MDHLDLEHFVVLIVTAKTILKVIYDCHSSWSEIKLSHKLTIQLRVLRNDRKCLSQLNEDYTET